MLMEIALCTFGKMKVTCFRVTYAPIFFREAIEYFSKSMLNDKLHLQQHGFVVENIRPIIKQKEEDTGMLSSKIPVSD